MHRQSLLVDDLIIQLNSPRASQLRLISPHLDSEGACVALIEVRSAWAYPQVDSSLLCSQPSYLILTNMNQPTGQQNESDMDVEEVEATSSGEAVLKRLLREWGFVVGFWRWRHCIRV